MSRRASGSYRQPMRPGGLAERRRPDPARWRQAAQWRRLGDVAGTPRLPPSASMRFAPYTIDQQIALWGVAAAFLWPFLACATVL